MIDYFSFSTKDAKQYGVDAAILLFHIRYWVAKNEANENNFHDEMFWTYNTTKAFAILFPFWSSRKIGRLLVRLEEEGAIISGNYNAKKYDRTKWFTLSKGLDKTGNIHLSKMTNAITENVEPIPYNNHNILQNTTKGELIFPFTSEKFLDFWAIWKQYKREEYMFTYKSQISEQAALKNLAKISNNNEHEAIELIGYAIAQGWKGIFKRKGRNTDSKFDSEKYRSYIESL